MYVYARWAHMVVTNIPDNAIFIQALNNFTNYIIICNIYAKSLNAFIIICKYLHKFVGCMVLNPLTAKFFNLNFHPREVVSR